MAVNCHMLRQTTLLRLPFCKASVASQSAGGMQALMCWQQMGHSPGCRLLTLPEVLVDAAVCDHEATEAQQLAMRMEGGVLLGPVGDCVS